MSNPKTSRDTPKSTSLQGSGAGQKPSPSPAGQQTDLFGQPLAPALPSPSRVKDKSARSAKARSLCGALDELATQYARTAATHGLPMPATYGRKFGDSSRSVALDRYSESRLTEFLRSIGSPLYKHRLTCSVTLLERRVFRLRASALPISDRDSSGWHTPTRGTRLGGSTSTTVTITASLGFRTREWSRDGPPRWPRTGEQCGRTGGGGSTSTPRRDGQPRRRGITRARKQRTHCRRSV